MKNSYEGIVIHCSDSTFGNAQLIEDWHKERGWSDIGYHFVILNGKFENNSELRVMDGMIEAGRDMDRAGAHARGYNNWLGICLIGVDKFTDKQFDSLHKLILELMAKYHIPLKNIIGHYQCKNNGGKTCPNFDVDQFKINYIGYKE